MKNSKTSPKINKDWTHQKPMRLNRHKISQIIERLENDLKQTRNKPPINLGHIKTLLRAMTPATYKCLRRVAKYLSLAMNKNPEEYHLLSMLTKNSYLEKYSDAVIIYKNHTQ